MTRALLLFRSISITRVTASVQTLCYHSENALSKERDASPMERRKKDYESAGVTPPKEDKDAEQKRNDRPKDINVEENLGNVKHFSIYDDSRDKTPDREGDLSNIEGNATSLNRAKPTDLSEEEKHHSQ